MVSDFVPLPFWKSPHASEAEELSYVWHVCSHMSLGGVLRGGSALFLTAECLQHANRCGRQQGSSVSSSIKLAGRKFEYIKYRNLYFSFDRSVDFSGIFHWQKLGRGRIALRWLWDKGLNLHISLSSLIPRGQQSQDAHANQSGTRDVAHWRCSKCYLLADDLGLSRGL